MKFKPLYLSALLALAVSPLAVGHGNPFADARAEERDAARFLALKERVGRLLFHDTRLSEPAGQSCASCHDAGTAFSDPDKWTPTSQGVDPGLFGSRNTPTAMYMAFSPAFYLDGDEGTYVGGQFLDGRAATLEEQAKGPFLNPVEMANPDRRHVVDKVRAADYAPLFKWVYGQDVFADADAAYDKIADAIAAFERTRALHPFSSKYDAWLNGKARLTAQELRGLAIFEREDKGNCAACHPSRPAEDGTPPLFTDFTYDNLGVPRNPDNAFYRMRPEFNPHGWNFVDKGLGGALGLASEDGKFKVPTLRNIAVSAPYMHNGYFRSLRDVVDFYNTRDVKPQCPKAFVSADKAVKNGCWPKAEVADNVNGDELGKLGLREREVDDLVAFLETLTDGWRSPSGR